MAETQSWAVAIERNGEEVCTLGHNFHGGREISEEDARIIRLAARCLLSFVGPEPTPESTNMRPLETLGCGCIIDSLGKTTPCGTHQPAHSLSDPQGLRALVAEMDKVAPEPPAIRTNELAAYSPITARRNWWREGYTAAQRDCRAKLESALARHVEPQDWQPIATAPKDGTRVLIYFQDSDDSLVRIGRWGDVRQSWLVTNIGPVAPTHWMKLPDPPTSF